MNWDKNNHIVGGMYNDVPYAGRVRRSYINSLDEVHHIVDLFEPIYVDGLRHESIIVNDLPILSTDKRQMSA